MEIISPGGIQFPGGDAGEDDPAVQAIYAEVAIAIMDRKTIPQIARELGMHPLNVQDIKKREGYRRVAREIYADTVAAARASLLGLMSEATEAIAQVLADPSSKGAPARLAAAFGVLDRAQHIMPADDGKEIRRILTRVPRPEALPEGLGEAEGDNESGNTSGDTSTPPTPSGTPVDAPTAWGLPAGEVNARRSVVARRVGERRTGMYRDSE